MVVKVTDSFGGYRHLKAIFFIYFSLASVSAFADSGNAVWRYTVRPGDNLITLGKTHLINPDDWKVVQRLNQIKDPYFMPIGQVLKVPVELVKQGPANAQVVFVSGQVQWQQSASNFEVLKVGQKLGAGAVIVTKDKSKVVIKFADETTAELTSNSTLRLDTLSLYSGGAMVDTKLRLQSGQLETYANPGHAKGNSTQVITPSAIAAVRGTKFRVTSNQDATTQETLDGQVALGAANQEVVVDKGFGSKVELGKAPTPPVALLPAADTQDFKKYYQTLPITFDMPAVQGADAWAGKISTDVKLDQLVAENEMQGSQLVFAEIPDGQYYLSLRAKDKNGIAGYDALHQFTLNARPLQPVFVAPAYNHVVREKRPELTWDASEGAQAYTVEVASDASFEKLVETKEVTGTTHQLGKALTEGQYFWRVFSIAKLEDGQEDVGPALNVSKFIYKPLPIKPDISQLTINVSENRVYVDTVNPLNGYTYQASLDNEFNDQKTVWEESGLNGMFNFLLKEYGKQTLYIRHLDSDGTLGPAAVYEFDAQPQ